MSDGSVVVTYDTETYTLLPAHDTWQRIYDEYVKNLHLTAEQEQEPTQQ